MPTHHEALSKKNTLLILPGWLQNSHQWAPAKEQLPNWHVHIIDLPGFGVEPLTGEDWGVPEYAQYAEEKIRLYLAAHTHDKTVLLGHSFGGRLLAHILSSPHNTLQPSHLILFGAPCIYRPSFSIRARRFAARALRFFGLSSPIHTLLPKNAVPYDLREADSAHLGSVFRRVVGFDQTDALKKITTPTTLLWGSLDDATPLPLAEEMRALLPRASLEILSSEKHNIHLENPTLFYGTLRRILARST